MKELILPSGNSNNPVDFEPVFNMLNDELSAINKTLDLICAGGYVMQLHGFRGTADIDAFFSSNAEINSIIRKVGDAFGINKPDELWLNNSISNMNPEPPARYCEVVHQFSNLTVKAVELKYLIGMKLTSARGQDIKDVSEILKNDENLHPLDLLSALIDMDFDVDISILLDAFEGARGMEWLEMFYRDNESDLQRFF